MYANQENFCTKDLILTLEMFILLKVAVKANVSPGALSPIRTALLLCGKQ